MPQLRPRAAVALMAGLCACAAVATYVSRPWLLTPEPDAANIYIRLLLGVCWNALCAGSLACVYLASRAGFGTICGLTTSIGLVVMAVGREGLGGLDAGLASCIAAVMTISAACSIWLTLRSPHVTAADRVWRLFIWLSSIGTVYLYSAEPQEAGAHIAAFSLSMLGCALVVSAWPSVLRTATAVLQARPDRLSLFVWSGAVLALAANAIVARSLGLATPQIVLGPLSLAPYFVAAALTLLGVALDVVSLSYEGPHALARTTCGLAACAVLYVAGLSESGTLAVVAVGTCAVILMSAPPLLAGAAALTILGTQSVLQSRVVIDLIQPYQPRVAERLLDWSNQAAPPDQLLRVAESLQFAGAVGHAGGARLRFLIGPEVAKDYAPALVAAQGGWIGLGLVLVGSLLLLAELYMGIHRTQRPVARALQLATLALVISNLLVTTLWLGGMTPFVGVPLPLLARAGSHLTAFALILLAYDTVSEADRALIERTRP